MIRVIDGKRYDTDKAELIFSWDNGRGCGDFRQREKSLFRTSKGAWFIYHSGGPMTDMSVAVGDGMGGSEDIEPVDADDAYGFLEAHSDDRDALRMIDEHFADRVEDA